MNALDRIYASSGPEKLHPTLAITDGVATHYLTTGFDDIEALLETGQLVTFIGYGLDISLPEVDSGSVPDLLFAICNVEGMVGQFIRDCMDAGREMTLTYRLYQSGDLGAPAAPPLHFDVKGGTVTVSDAQVKAGYDDLLSTAWPRFLFDVIRFPGLRHMNG